MVSPRLAPEKLLFRQGKFLLPLFIPVQDNLHGTITQKRRGLKSPAPPNFMQQPIPRLP